MRRHPPVGIAVSTKTRSPQTIGDADALPGISTFQRMFFVSLHSTGGSPCGAAPVASGPRHWGQNISASLDCGAAVANAQRQAKRTVRVGGSCGRETPKRSIPLSLDELLVAHHEAG